MADELMFLLALLLTTVVAIAPIVGVADWRPVVRFERLERFDDVEEGR